MMEAVAARVQRTAATTARAWLDAMNSHDGARLRALLSDDFSWESGSVSSCGPDHAERAWRAWFAFVPDLALEPQRALGRGDWTMQQLRLRGTHRNKETAGFAPHPQPAAAIGARFDLPGCAVHVVRDGRITRLWTYWDEGALLRSIGATHPHANF